MLMIKKQKYHDSVYHIKLHIQIHEMLKLCNGLIGMISTNCQSYYMRCHLGTSTEVPLGYLHRGATWYLHRGAICVPSQRCHQVTSMEVPLRYLHRGATWGSSTEVPLGYLHRGTTWGSSTEVTLEVPPHPSCQAFDLGLLLIIVQGKYPCHLNLSITINQWTSSRLFFLSSSNCFLGLINCVLNTSTGAIRLLY